MKAIQEHPDLELQLVLGASALLDRYGTVSDQIKQDGFEPLAEVFMLIEGETPTTMAKSTGVGLMELPTVFDRLKPDIVLTVGDRFETMATTLAAAYMNFPVAHTMGGEVTGTIDESIRHAVTKFAHIHFPASKDAKERIIKLGEREEHVYLVGCPRMDLVAEILNNRGLHRSLQEGVGADIDIDKPFILVSQHPVTTEYGEGEDQIIKTLKAVESTGLPAIVLWPNADAGSDDIARGMRKWREKGLDENMHFYKNLPVNHYIYLMKKASCLIGNSSSGIREGAFIGTPVVNIGTRQDMRERGKNVIDVPSETEKILNALERQIEHGPYESEPIYGDGTAGEKIADILSKCSWKIQKLITY
jgi:UDP-hydrolysing UDP-N-acetyl-D-glucosamine 2-epimerase